MADFLEEIDEALRDYSRIFPPPCALAPNLQLAVEAAAEVRRFREELRRALAAVGLPEDADLEVLIRHHRAQSGAATAFDILAAEGRGAIPLTDEEWRAFQQIPDQGYSHRHWIDHKIALRVAAATEARDTAQRPQDSA